MAAITRSERKQRRRSSLTPSWWQAYIFGGPALLVMLGIFLYPIAYSFVMSFFRWQLSAAPTIFVGLQNYVNQFTGPEFQQSLKAQLIFSFFTLAFELTAGMAIALLLNSKLRGLRAARTLLLIPPMVAPAVVGLNFRWLFNEQYGFFDTVLRDVGLPVIPWLNSSGWALVSVMIADAWQNTPLMVLLFIAAMQSLPGEPLEAALVDGANAWRTFWLIMLPLLRPIIVIALMIRIIDTFRTFDVVWLMTQGGPGGATNLISVYAYNLAFQAVDFGDAAAVSYIALALSLVFLAILYGAPWFSARLRGRLA